MARRHIPEKVREVVLKEYNHRCAICGGDRPQIHHIDENHDNNDPMNLIPLCPNHHLSDQHNPTAQISIPILRLFREYKDPTILRPQFKPIYDRMFYLYSCSDLSSSEIEKAQQALTDFITCLEMGAYYEKRIWVVNPVRVSYFDERDVPVTEAVRESAQGTSRLRQIVTANGKTVERLIIELLRYQRWSQTKPTSNGSGPS